MKDIYLLHELPTNCMKLAGGKGRNLSIMAKNGLPVPEGFVILSRAFRRFLSENKIDLEIERMVKAASQSDIESLKKISDKIRELILEGKISAELGQKMLLSFKALNAKYVAVRSSAVSEDARTHSWAGELESYLNVTRSNLIRSVKKCWASLYTPRAIFYMLKMGLEEEEMDVAVVVQKMVQSEVSGVCFTADPISGNENRMIIESVFGLGELLVQGKVMPDRYVVDKRTLRILKIERASQQYMLALRNGKNRKVSLPEEKRNMRKLSEAQIKKLSEICAKIEKIFNYPQDIEWALEEGKFYVVQSRPITTL